MTVPEWPSAEAIAASYRNSDPRPPIMLGSPPAPEWRLPPGSWDRPPWNRWALQNTRRILPTAEVWRGTGPIAALGPSDLQPVEEIRFESVSGRESTVAEMLDETYTDGFLVIHRGRLIHESYWNGMGPRSLHIGMSVSKSVAALACGALIGEGLMAPEMPVTDLLPELAGTAWAGAEIGHLLDMQGGTTFEEDYTGPRSDIALMFAALGWKSAPGGEAPSGIWELILTRQDREAAHGTRFAYRSLETDVLAHAMERAAGATLAEIVSSRIWQRIGTEESAGYALDPVGYGLGCGGFHACLRDYARLGLLMLSGGRVADAQIVPEGFVEDVFTGSHGLFNDQGREAHPNGIYRNQFWIEDRDRGTVLMKGVFGQLVLVDRDADTVAVKLSSWPDYRVPAYDFDARRAIRAIQAALA